MDVTALCIRLLLDVLLLLIAQVQQGSFVLKADAAFPRIVPDRLQFFEYETISVHCEDKDESSGWRVMTKKNKITLSNSSDCHTSAPSCTIYLIFKRHSGEYWCEDEEGRKSDAVNISVTAGSVILESPARPVFEGEDVTLYCKNKRTQSKHIADYYKDGSRLGTQYMGNMTIQNVSMADEGLYKCSISGAGESPESWLKISKQTPDENTTDSPHSVSPHQITPLWIVVVALLAALLLLVVGLLLCRKHKVFVCFSSEKSTPGSHTVPEESVVDPHHATYAVVVKQRKEKGHGNVADPDNVTYSVVKMKKKEPKVCRANTDPRLQEESCVYSSVNYR